MSGNPSSPHGEKGCGEGGAHDGDFDSDATPIDYDTLHPSVRFYRGMWQLTQLQGDPAPETAEQQRHCSTDLMADSACPSPSTPLALSVVGLHQRLLPPAPVHELGDAADESYAAQLATPYGLELLRVNWHALLPLLFPCVRGDAESVDEAHHTAAAAARNVNESKKASTAAATAEGRHDGEGLESTWTTAELLQRVQTPLTLADLKVIREPGLMDRLYYSYIVFLRFFGWRVHDEERGLLDRNRAWQQRYDMLARHRLPAAAAAVATEGQEERESRAPARGVASAPLPPPPTYEHFDFYADGLPRVLRTLLDVGFLRLGVRLVEFVMEEMQSDRLVFLRPLTEGVLLPMVVLHEGVEASHKTRLEKRLYRLTHSDSD